MCAAGAGLHYDTINNVHVDTIFGRGVHVFTVSLTFSTYNVQCACALVQLNYFMCSLISSPWGSRYTLLILHMYYTCTCTSKGDFTSLRVMVRYAGVGGLDVNTCTCTWQRT